MIEATSGAAEYFAKELAFLREYYQRDAEETRTLERYALVTTGAIWSWCASNLGKPGFHLLMWAPVLLDAFFGLRAWSVYQEMRWKAGYLRKLEERIALPSDFGWERSVTEHRHRTRVRTAYLFWWGLWAASTLIAVYASWAF